jgi:peptide/nickel transport system permease protein
MSESSTNTEDVSFSERIGDNPRPALLWVLGVVALVVVELGALVGVIIQFARGILGLLPGNPGVSTLTAVGRDVAAIPTLLSRDIIPNRGYNPPGPGWESTFLGLEPKYAWLLRFVLIYAYAFIWLGWFWVGYRWFRTHYRYADWTPRDDMMDRLRGHRWGQFGFAVVFAFLVLAMFAPSLSPYPIESNIYQPYSATTTYFSATANMVQEIPVGAANLQSVSQGSPGRNVGVWTYDDFGRFHPFGTNTSGADFFTFLAYGARISLMIGVVSIAIAGVIGLVFSMLTAYYKGLADLAVVITGDSIQSLPLLLLIILLSAVFAGTWLVEIYDGAVFLILVFAATYWPYQWRAVRGPALQVAEEEWIDAAKSFGQRPRTIMRKHMLPYIAGYLLIYASLSIGGIIIAISALGYLGLGVAPPTPEWGRAVSAGQPYVASVSWHVALIPGVLITLVVMGFNALGDGIRDALDPQSSVEGEGEGGNAAAAAGGGGG